MVVALTQFLRPDGRQVPQATEVSDDCKAGYKAMQEAGCRLTAEVLLTGEVSCCIEHSEGDFDISVTQNGPEVQQGIEKMLRRFDRAAFDKWLEAQR